MGWMIVLLLVLIALLLALPVKLAAGMVGARRTGFGWALLALVIQQFVSGVLKAQGFGWMAETALLALACAAVYSLVLDTTLLRGFAVGLLAVILGALLYFGLLAMLGMFGLALVL
ncbi:MAG TPA: hypothetical protein PKC23_05725 [Candidatus Desulfobacillus sp.]|nr:hypothetical protein [Candidatus Desulfobacillus sp.]